MRYFNQSLASLFIFSLLSCGGEDKVVIKEQTTSSNLIEISNKQFELGKLELGQMSFNEFHSNLKVNGILDVPPENKAIVSVYFGGFVKEIKLLPGEKVRKGQQLFILENPDFVQVQQDYLEAKSNLKYLKQDFERQKSLSEGNVSSQKTFSKAESDYKVAFARFESLKKKLSLMNISPNSVSESNLRSTVAIISPISGYVTNLNITKGMYLNPSDKALTVTNGDVIHVELTVFEQDLANVKIGQTVKFKLDNDVNEYEATIHLINKAIDPEKRTINVHCDLKNKQQSSLFIPGMYVEGEIETTSNNQLSLPDESIVKLNDLNYVLMLKKKNSKGYVFERKIVEIGESNNRFTSIKNSREFSKGTSFLINGAFNLIKD